MNQLVRTCVGTPFSEASMRLNLKLPVAPFRMPSPDGGTLLLKGYEGDCDNAGCGGQPQPSGGCNTEKTSCGCTQKKPSDKCDDKCKEKVLERFELVEYSGYEENGDGLTLVITKRGVQGTSKLNWCSGIEVTQLTDTNTTYHFTDLPDGRWRVEVRDIRGNLISSEIHGHVKTVHHDDNLQVTDDGNGKLTFQKLHDGSPVGAPVTVEHHEKTVDTFGTMELIINDDGSKVVIFTPNDNSNEIIFTIPADKSKGESFYLINNTNKTLSTDSAFVAVNTPLIEETNNPVSYEGEGIFKAVRDTRVEVNVGKELNITQDNATSKITKMYSLARFTEHGVVGNEMSRHTRIRAYNYNHALSMNIGHMTTLTLNLKSGDEFKVEVSSYITGSGTAQAAERVSIRIFEI